MPPKDRRNSSRNFVKGGRKGVYTSPDIRNGGSTRVVGGRERVLADPDQLKREHCPVGKGTGASIRTPCILERPVPEGEKGKEERERRD